MTRAKKVFSALLISLLAIVVVAILVANRLLDRYSRQAITKLSQRAEDHDIEISGPSFTSARIAGIRTARWTDLRARLKFPTHDVFAAGRSFDVRVGQAELWLVGSGMAMLEARDVDIDATEMDSFDETINESGADTSVLVGNRTRGEQFRVERFRIQLEIDLFHATASVEQALPELIGLMRSGATQLPLEIEGTIKFIFKDSPVKARVRVDQIEGGQALVLAAEDLQPVSAQFDEALTEAEAELIATYPLRVARLLQIKDDAESTAATAKQHDDQVPQDAYRHVLWSYLLTREFGARFAERVTNAHEQGDTGNSPAERRMDLHNNALGRRWAEENLRRNEILALVLTDPEVIREPR